MIVFFRRLRDFHPSGIPTFRICEFFRFLKRISNHSDFCFFKNNRFDGISRAMPAYSDVVRTRAGYGPAPGRTFTKKLGPARTKSGSAQARRQLGPARTAHAQPC